MFRSYRCHECFWPSIGSCPYLRMISFSQLNHLGMSSVNVFNIINISHCNFVIIALRWITAPKLLTWYFFPLISTGFPFGPIQNISWGPADRQVNNAFPPVVWKYISDHWWIFGLVGLWQVVSVSKPKKKRGVKLKFVSNKNA